VLALVFLIAFLVLDGNTWPCIASWYLFLASFVPALAAGIAQEPEHSTYDKFKLWGYAVGADWLILSGVTGLAALLLSFFGLRGVG
jgi:hypothetical protein